MFKKNYLFVSLLLFQQTFYLNANENDKYSQSVYGGIGLIQTPTARFHDDGEFGFGFSTEEPWNRLYGRMQFFPWLEATVRYTEGKFQPYQPGMDQTWKDKGIDLKLKLLEESDSFPALAVGLADIGGTGAFSSEYIVASKSINNIDLTLGLGWGRLAGTKDFDNPVGWIDKNRKKRGGYVSTGGKINLSRFFSGDSASIFGGIEYFTPVENLSLKLEYDSTDYSSVDGKERNFKKVGDIFSLDSRLNYALNYRIELGTRDNLDLSIGYLRGNTLYANFNLHSNLNFSGNSKINLGPEKIRNSTYPEESFEVLDERWKKFIKNRLIREMTSLGFITHKIIFNGDELAAEISQGRFLETIDYLDLASRVLANNAPRNIKTITVINIDQGIETMRSSIPRDKLRRALRKGPLTEDMFLFDRVTFDQEGTTNVDNEILYPNFSWKLLPHALGTLQHQEKFYFWQLEALIQTEYSFRKGLYLYTDIGINIANNYEDYTYHIPDGDLHHVRQDRRLYLTEGESGLRRMAVDYLVELSTNIKGKFSVGYIEWMYGGIGGEVIYMPANRKWALGLDSYFVKQREFDQKFSFRDYETVTGFVTFYRDIPFYDLRLELSAGKFLGKDKGFQIDLSRRFSTGARVGGGFALTDCDSQCVGEGSFNKWIYFELPMDLFYINSSTRSKAGYQWAPLTKDAGQKIASSNLYDIVKSAPDEIDSLRTKQLSIRKIFNGFGVNPKKRL